MGRLIDADAITESNELATKIVSYNLTPYIKVDDLLEFIDNLPTVYNVEKVVSEFEERKGNVFIDGKLMYQEDYFIDIDDAIDIVKRGGVE